MGSLHELEEQGDYAGIINEVRRRISEDVKAFRDPSIKAWIGRRWRNLFIHEAARDTHALRAASTGLRYLFADRRPSHRKIAERFLPWPYNREWDVEMPPADFQDAGRTTLLFCPGLLNGILPLRAFGDGFPRLEERTGIKVLRADSHPLRGSSANAGDIRRALELGEGRDAHGALMESPVPPGPVLVLCYSKGVCDMLTLLAEDPDVASRIRGIIAWGGPAAGSPIADEIHGKIRNLDLKTAMQGIERSLKKLLPAGLRLSETISSARLEEYAPVDALRDLTTTRNRAFLDTNKTRLEGLDIPMFFAAGATRALDVPWIQLRGYCALKEHDRANDMQVTRSGARIPLPMALDLGLLKAHHWDMAYPAFVKRRYFNNLRHDFPREAALTALVHICGELGILDWRLAAGDW